MENNNQSFWQFSDQLRHQTSNFANLSVNDSIWGSSYGSKRHGERMNFDVRVGGEVNSLNNLNPKASDLTNGFNDVWDNPKAKGPASNGFNDVWDNLKTKGSASDGFNDGWNSFKPKVSEFNGFNDGWNSFKPKSTDFNGFNEGWKMGTSGLGAGPVLGGVSQKNVGINGAFNKGIYSKPGHYNNINSNINLKSHKNGGKGEDEHGVRVGKKNANSNKKNNNDNNNDNKDGKSASDKRFKTLPPSESLPRNETVGGYIFVCNNDTMQENLKRQLFGMLPNSYFCFNLFSFFASIILKRKPISIWMNIKTQLYLY